MTLYHNRLPNLARRFLWFYLLPLAIYVVIDAWPSEMGGLPIRPDFDPNLFRPVSEQAISTPPPHWSSLSRMMIKGDVEIPIITGDPYARSSIATVLSVVTYLPLGYFVLGLPAFLMAFAIESFWALRRRKASTS